MKINEVNEKLIELTEIAKMIKTKNKLIAQKWCEDLGLPIIVIGRKKMSYRFLVETELDKRFIQLLKKKYPNNWEELYRYYQENDHYGYVIASQSKIKKRIKASKHTKPLSKEAIEFANEL